jgi:hypothetical protein
MKGYKGMENKIKKSSMSMLQAGGRLLYMSQNIHPSDTGFVQAAVLCFLDLEAAASDGHFTDNEEDESDGASFLKSLTLRLF